MNFKDVASILVISFLLAACESADLGDQTGSPDGNPISNFGSSNSELVNSGDEVDADTLISVVGLIKLEPGSTATDFSRALFGRLDTSLSASDIQTFYAPADDVCEVTAVSADDGDADPGLKIYEQQAALISGGGNVILTGNAGTYATLYRVDGSAGPFYRTEVALSGDRPTDLTVSIPGEEFPAFNNIVIEDVPEFLISTADVSVNATTEFSWNANPDPLSIVEVYTSGIGASNETILVSCSVVDDGSFLFPESVRAEMGDSYSEDWSANLRVVYNIVRSDDVLLLTANSTTPLQ